MRIDKESCIGCEECIPYCNVNAISMVGDKAEIDKKNVWNAGYVIGMMCAQLMRLILPH